MKGGCSCLVSAELVNSLASPMHVQYTHVCRRSGVRREIRCKRNSVHIGGAETDQEINFESGRQCFHLKSVRPVS